MPELATYYSSTQCGSSTHILSVGSQLPTPSKLYRLAGRPTKCEPEDGPPASANNYYAVTPVAPSEWVGFQREVVPLSPSIGVEGWRGEDGSQIVGSFQLLREKMA